MNDPIEVVSGKRQRRGRWRRRSIAAVAFAFSALITSASPLLAHSDLVDSKPMADAVLDQAPDMITLNFAAGVQPQGGAITVTGPNGDRYDLPSTFQTATNQATIELTALSEPGAYTVRYRLVSADGHVIGDSYGFRLTKQAIAPADPSDQPLTERPSPAPGTTSSQPATTASDGGVDTTLVLGIGFLLLASVAAVTLVITRRRDDDSPP